MNAKRKYTMTIAYQEKCGCRIVLHPKEFTLSYLETERYSSTEVRHSFETLKQGTIVTDVIAQVVYHD